MKGNRRTAGPGEGLKILASAFEVGVGADKQVGDGLSGKRPRGGGVGRGFACLGRGGDRAGGAHGGHGAQDDSCGFGVHFEVD